jgi:hypothetical protein
MCNFISWIEYDNKNYFLTSKDLETKEGRKLLQKDVRDDICGHGAIRAYYSELKNLGINKECEDFSSPKNFPNDIIRAIKTGQFEDIGICLDILNDKGKKEYDKIKAIARAEYDKIEAIARAEYDKIEAPAWAEYDKIKAIAWAEYDKIKASAFWKIAKQKKYRIGAWK